VFLDNETIKSVITLKHPRFQELKDDDRKIFYSLPFENYDYAYLILKTGIDKKFPKTCFLEARFYDNEINSYFGRKYIVKIDNEKKWEKDIHKLVTFTYKSLVPFTCSCGFFMIAKMNKNGNFFLSCTNYPECNGIKSINDINEFLL